MYWLTPRELSASLLRERLGLEGGSSEDFCSVSYGNSLLEFYFSSPISEEELPDFPPDQVAFIRQLGIVTLVYVNQNRVPEAEVRRFIEPAVAENDILLGELEIDDFGGKWE